MAAVFILTLRLTPQSVFQFLEAANVGLVAWLFYDISRQLASAQPTDSTITHKP